MVLYLVNKQYQKKNKNKYSYNTTKQDINGFFPFALMYKMKKNI